MSTMSLSQKEADTLFEMEKVSKNKDIYSFPLIGRKITIPLSSKDNKEEFILDIQRGRISIAKVTMQNRARKIFILRRIDTEGAIHTNPDGEDIPCPHMHCYQEDFGDKWAYPLPKEFEGLTDPKDIFNQFMSFCNVVEKPTIDEVLL